MGIIEIEGMEFFSFHGHFAAEQVVGNRFIVDIRVVGECSRAGQSDQLADAIDYQLIYALVKEQMAIPSHLLEHVCSRILEHLFLKLPEIREARVKVRKMNPPMGGRMDSVAVTLDRKGPGWTENLA